MERIYPVTKSRLEKLHLYGVDGSAWAKNLNVYSKSVPGPDEDVINCC